MNKSFFVVLSFLITQIIEAVIGVISGVIGFFGIIHTCVGFVAFIAGICFGVPALSMFGIALGVGSCTALIHTVVGMILNNIKSSSAFKHCKENLEDYIKDTFAVFLSIDRDSCNPTERSIVQTPLSYGILLGCGAVVLSKYFLEGPKYEQSSIKVLTSCARGVLFANYGR
jgi:hypothetical protein